MWSKYANTDRQKELEYRFDGIKDQLVTISKKVGISHSSDLHVKADQLVIVETSTYETTRIVIKHLDQYQRPLIYSNEVVNIHIDGPLEVIGPSNLALIGGSTGFYVKTLHKKGIAKITISSNNFDDKSLELEVM